jgi:hypothetical protein
LNFHFAHISTDLCCRNILLPVLTSGGGRMADAVTIPDIGAREAALAPSRSFIV